MFAGILFTYEINTCHYRCRPQCPRTLRYSGVSASKASLSGGRLSGTGSRWVLGALGDGEKRRTGVFDVLAEAFDCQVRVAGEDGFEKAVMFGGEIAVAPLADRT